MTAPWHDAVGLVGVFLILFAYLFLQLGRWTTNRFAYSAVNALGAACVLASLAVNFNLSAFVVEAFWLAISLVGIAKWVARQKGRERF